MDADKAFEEIRNDIARGAPDVNDRIRDLAVGDADPMTRIKCLSLLKVVGDDGLSKEILGMLMGSLPEGREDLVQVAGALRGLEYPANAVSILESMDEDDSILRLTALCLMDLEEYEEARSVLSKISQPAPADRVMLTEILSSLGEHGKAVDTAAELLGEMPREYGVRKAYVTALILAGRGKEAAKYARAGLKDKSADSNALAAYVLLVDGNTKAAAGYATRALNIDNRHISAMETLGICLAEKGEVDKARIVAGAINEISPGDRAALRVLSRCRQ